MVDLSETRTTTCKRCGKEFKIYRSQTTGRWNYRNFCDECNGPEKIKTVICEACGKPFQIERVAWGGFSGRKYCDNCDITKKQTKTAICKKCGKPFELERRKNKGGFVDRLFCDDCLIDNKPTKTLVCQECGKDFTVDRYKTTNGFKYRKYCDDCLKEKKKLLTCKRCGKDFESSLSKDGKEHKNYCPICRREIWIEKAIKTCQEKYGVDFPCQRPECYEHNGIKISKINIYFHDMLCAQGLDVDYEKTIKNFSYDLCIESLKTVIEINPTYTHSVLGNHFTDWKENKLFKNRHILKTNVANSEGYRCIQVWQWDDWDKIIKTLQTKQKLYARKLQLKEITKQEANRFLDLYHLQSSCRGNSVNLGLYQDDELIQVMTFGKPRYNKNYQWELLRLCTCSDYYVVGGAEKLFKYFVRNYKPESVISYCDISKFTGDVYERLNFKLKVQTKPQKIWSINNYNFGNNEYITDNLLRQRGYDQLFNTNYGKGTDNEQLMIEQGWLPVYDCGQKVFEYKKENN